MADLRGRKGRTPPSSGGSKFFQFHAFFGIFWQKPMLAPAGELAPRGNPGSATGIDFMSLAPTRPLDRLLIEVRIKKTDCRPISRKM